MTSGAHDDGELGEIFLKLGKQGSTLAGVMDAFSIAVSIGLQYGVPLETYVSKFTNLRFEPAGLTDDPRRADGAVDHGLHLPPPGPGLPVLRRPLDARHLLRRGAPAPARDRLLRAGRRSPRPSPSRPTPRSTRSAVEEGAGGAPAVETKDTHGAEAARSRRRRAEGRPHLRRADGEDHRHGGRHPALLHLRHQDAPRRLLLRLRGLRQHQRLQLTAPIRERPRRVSVGAAARQSRDAPPVCGPARSRWKKIQVPLRANRSASGPRYVASCCLRPSA